MRLIPSIILFALSFVLVPDVIFAQLDAEQEIHLLTNIPGLSSAAQVAVQGDFTSLINVVYKVAIGLSAALAVLFLIFEGVRYSASVIPGVKEKLRERMTTLIGGMALLLCAYVLLEVVNPSLLRFDNLSQNLIALDYSEIEGIKGYDAFGDLGINIPDDPSQAIYTYVPFDVDGKRIPGEYFFTLSDCLALVVAKECKLIEINTPPPTEVIDPVAIVALSELQMYGGKHESATVMCNRIQDYSQLVVGHRNWNCTASEGSGPWSAIFVSYIMKTSGNSSFPVSAVHWTYINLALEGKNGMKAHRYGAGYRPQAGDLMCTSRGSDRTTFDSALSKGSYSSHCDVVVENNGKHVITVGGNLSQTVKRAVYVAQDGVPRAAGKHLAIIELP